MPTTQVLTPPVAAAEPVSLALVNAWARLDLDATLVSAYEAGSVPTGADPALVAQLDVLAVTRTAARELVEQYIGAFLAPQTVAFTFRLNEAYALPLGSTAVSVSGFFTDLSRLPTASSYLEEYRKGISIERELPWGYALQQTYTVVVNLTAPSVPSLAKSAVLELTAEWFRNRESTVADVRNVTELPVSWKVKLAPLRQSPLGIAA